MLRSPKTNQRQERRLSLQVTGTGTAAISIGSGLAELVDNGTGDYTLTFKQPFARLPIAVATSLTKGYVQVSAITTTTVHFLTFTDAGAAQDAVFFAEVIGWDTADEYKLL